MNEILKREEQYSKESLADVERRLRNKVLDVAPENGDSRRKDDPHCLDGQRPCLALRERKKLVLAKAGTDPASKWKSRVVNGGRYVYAG